MHRLVASIMCTLMLVGHGDDESNEVKPCPRKPPKHFPSGTVTTIKDADPPCHIEFHEIGTRLEGTADGSQPDPGRTVLMDSNGRYISANARGWEATVSVWDTRGSYLYSFGREGRGPGEFTVRGMLNLFIDGRDILHVRDGSFTWSVFSQKHEFLNQVSAEWMRGMSSATVILDDGSALASDLRGDRSRYFRVVDSTGVVKRRFGRVDGDSDWRLRPITHAGGDTFWAGPPALEGDEYVLEEWSTDGKLLRTFRRDVSWWRWRGDPDISSAVVQVHLAHNGLLYVLSRRPTREYVRQFERDRTQHGGVPGPQDVLARRERRDAGTEAIVEVIDTRSGDLLATQVYPMSQARELFPRNLFRGSLLGYRYQEGDGGVPVVEIVSVELRS